MDLATYIDHTLLKPAATAADVKTLCTEAREYGFAAVCINPVFVPLAARELSGSPVKVCTVIGFPLGATTSGTKAHEAAEAVGEGATEIDMVLALGATKSGDLDYARDDIEAVVHAAAGNAVKLILETCLLSDEEKVAACRLAVEAGTSFVKTSTGFGGGGATAADIRLMRDAVGPDFGVKASGGIRRREDALAMIEAGATRIGTSSSVAIVMGE